MSISLKPVQDQVVVITGASSGIGMAAALTFAAAGARVVCAARSEDALRNVVAQITSAGGQAIHVVADVTHREQVQAIADAAIQRFGRIDTWVNDAGVAIFGRLDEVTDDDSRQLFETNFWGVVYGSLVALPHLKKQGGALINVGSEVSDASVPLLGMYSASKHAVKGFTDSLRIELEEVDDGNVAVTLIQPTATDTPFPENARNYMAQEPKLPTPMIDPQKVADAIVHAAAHHERAVKVGAMAKVNSAMARMAPAIGEKMAAKQADRLQREQPPRDPQGTLFKAGEKGRIKGAGNAKRIEDAPPSTR